MKQVGVLCNKIMIQSVLYVNGYGISSMIYLDALKTLHIWFSNNNMQLRMGEDIFRSDN